MDWLRTTDLLVPSQAGTASLPYTSSSVASAKDHWTQIHSTNPLERPNGEIKRRTDVVASSPTRQPFVRLAGAMLLEQNDEWAVRRRYMSLEPLETLSDDAKAKPRRIAAA
jgi:putative transposase